MLIVSFVALSLAWRKPRFEGDRLAPVRGAACAGRSPAAPVELLCGPLGVFLFVVAIYSGLKGTEEPDRNFALTFLFITCWLGFAVFSVFAGDVFRAFNPWRAIARAASGLFRLASGGPAPPALSYPERLGRWPAAVGLVAFVWLELIYGSPVAQSVGLTPRTAVIAALGLQRLHLRRHGAVRDREVARSRRDVLGLLRHVLAARAARGPRRTGSAAAPGSAGPTSWAEAIPGSIALVLATIGTTTFDGAQEGALKTPINDTFNRFVDWGLGPLAALRVTNTIFLIVTLAFVAALYCGGIRGMQIGRRRQEAEGAGAAVRPQLHPDRARLSRRPLLQLLLCSTSRASSRYLLSDPLGDGSNLFGTAGSGIDYSSIGSTAIWYVQVGALVAGHVTALVLGHDKALAIYGDVRRATRSQYWMLALMVGFTTLGLFLLSQANG